ncbi:MAG: hypothetical protein DMG31_15160 [Acidobacteria bacterium]|nr:MAG: hypothetical protein DMG31_15160 [Acidobacteriota bacterium]
MIGKSLPLQRTRKLAMTYSYTQIAQYLRCPRSYRYRYLDGWKEKDSRATLLFGRCFEQALGAYFRREDSSAAPSVVTSKPANGGQGKTGQRRWPGTWFFYPVFT